MNSANNYIIEQLDLEEILSTIEICLKSDLSNNNLITIPYNKFISHKKISYYSVIFFFEEFYILKFFNKLFVFEYQDETYGEITTELSNVKNMKDYIQDKSIGLILNKKKVSFEDFINLKKCFMLTEKISYTETGSIYCKYRPYYLLEFTLQGNILKIYIDGLNLYCELNLNNIDSDIKSFLNQVFEGIPEKKLKMHYTILKYYASLK